VQEFPGVVRAEVVARFWLLGVEAVRQAEELGERVERVDPCPHGVGLRVGVRAAQRVTGSCPAGGRVP
jgi:hypothetical protein